jgi:multimeric flavodoxin WrbA
MDKKPRVLVLYYSQTGQLRHIIDNILLDIKNNLDITYAAIEPVKPYPFPWNPDVFFDTMPETVMHTPPPVKPLPDEIVNADYDLVIFGNQTWFLNPSQPITAFLQSPSAKVLQNKNVITVIGARNMWLHAQEKVKEYLLKQNAKLVGNIALVDNTTNIISTLTIIRWLIKGKKEATGMMPAAGVQEADIQKAQRYGMPIYRHLTENKLDSLHQELLMLGAVQIKTGLVLLEQTGIRNFRKWSKYIAAKGGSGAPERQGRVKQFKRLLLVAIFILSPITSLLAKIKEQIKMKKLKEDVAYFKQLKYEEGRL